MESKLIDPSLVGLFDDLVRVEIALWEAVDRRVRTDLDLPLGRVETLRAVATTPSCRVQEVARTLRVTVGAASKLVDRLEAGGLVTRTPHPTDRRSSVLAPTDEGRRVHEAAQAAVGGELQAWLGRAEDLTSLATTLAALRARLAPT